MHDVEPNGILRVEHRSRFRLPKILAPKKKKFVNFFYAEKFLKIFITKLSLKFLSSKFFLAIQVESALGWPGCFAGWHRTFAKEFEIARHFNIIFSNKASRGGAGHCGC